MAHILIPAHSVPFPMFEAADNLGVSAVELDDGSIAFRGRHSRIVVLLAEEYAPDDGMLLASAVADIQLEDENLDPRL